MDMEEKFKEKLYNLVKDEYTLIGKYIRSTEKVCIKHNKCGYEWDVYPGNILNKNTRCPRCAGNAKLTHSDFLSRVKHVHDDSIEVLSTYKGQLKKVDLQHECGYRWSATPNNILRGKGCPKCSGSMKLTQEQIDCRMSELFEGEYKFLEPYINSDTAIMCKHSCGHTWKVRPYNLFGGRKCPVCYRRSQGELFIQNILETNKVNFTIEKSFEGCKDKIALRFDFYLPNYNCVIEYDGEHHFLDNRYSKNSDSLEVVKKRDKIKDDFCRDNGINMIRIPYYMDDLKVKELILELLGGSKAENLSPNRKVMI